jgi:DNA polymerase III subunit beta
VSATMTRLAVQVDAADLASVTSWVARRLPHKPAQPVLGGILLTATEELLEVATFDHEVAARAEAPAGFGASPGRALVSGRLLAEYVKTLRSGRVELADDGAKVTLTCGRVKLTMPTMAVEDMPALPELPPAAGTVDGVALRTAVEGVALAAAKAGNPNPALTGVHVELGPDTLCLTATDSYRAATVEIGWSGCEPTTLLVDAGVLLGAVRGVAHGELAIHPSTTLIGLAGPDRTVISRLVDQPFPAIRGKITAIATDHPVRLEVSLVAEALRRAELAAGPRTPVRLSVDDDTLSVGASGDATSDEEVECDGAGQHFTALVNPTYFGEALAACDAGVVELHRSAQVAAGRPAPLMLTPPASAESTYRHLFMPIRDRGANGAT